MNSKHTKFAEKYNDLMSVYKEQLEHSPAKGNPFIAGIHARALGIKEVISHPLYDAAPEMLEALEELYDKYGDDDPFWHRAANAISKARGGE